MSAAPNVSLLRLENVSKRYASGATTEGVPVLAGVCLDVARGASLAIVGPIGSGKSTLLQIIGTLDHATSGDVFLAGKNLATLDERQLAEVRREQIGFVFQAYFLLPQCTVLENVLVPTMAMKAKADRTARAHELLKAVGLDHRATYRPAQLSGGERQRVAVVRALINEPRLILADEPTGNLDEANAAGLTDLLIDLQKQTGVSLVLVTHHRAQAERMGRVLQIHEGRIA